MLTFELLTLLIANLTNEAQTTPTFLSACDKY